MPYTTRAQAISEIEKSLEGADTRDTRFILQHFVDAHAMCHRKKMCVFPRCGYDKQGNHDWTDLKRLVNAGSCMNTPMTTVLENRHCGTIILNSSPDSFFEQEELPNGRFKITITTEVDAPVGLTSTFEQMHATKKSPFSKRKAYNAAAPEEIPDLNEALSMPEFIARPVTPPANFDVSSFLADSPPSPPRIKRVCMRQLL
jgi:hypothetical protein